MQPFLGALSDVFGRSQVIIPSIILFLIGSAVAGASNSVAVLLAGRVIQGLGGGGIQTLCQLVFADIVPLRQRPRFYAIVLAAWAVGIMAGPVIGAALAVHVSWRWCFYINLPIGGVSLAMSVFCFKLQPPVRKTLAEKMGSIDWTGSTLFTASLTVFLVAITNGGVGQPWGSWRTIVPLVIGAVGLVITMIWEQRFTRHPFLPREIFPNLSSIAIYLVALLTGFALYMLLYYYTLYLSAVQLEGPVQSGVKLLPPLVFAMMSSPVAANVITRFGAYRWAIWAGWVSPHSRLWSLDHGQ